MHLPNPSATRTPRVNIRPVAKILGLCVILGFSIHSGVGLAQTNHLVSFDREQYVIRGGETFPVSVLINPLPASGLYSFGVRLSIEPPNARVVGVGDIRVPGEFSFDGPRSMMPVVEVTPSSAAAKGTVEFHGSALRPASSNLLVTFYVTDLASGSYKLSLDFFNTLGETEQIFVDGQGNVLDPQIAFASATVVRDGGLAVGLLSALVLNRQTGLFEQDIAITNNSGAPIAGIRLLATNVPPSWVLRNAAGHTNGLPYLLHNFSVGSGQSVTLRAQYRIPDRQADFQPGYLAEALFSPEFPPTPSGASFVIAPRLELPDGSFLLEFSSLSDRSYSIQYARDLTNWFTVAPALRGTGSRVQWIDYGPPKTATPPTSESQRFYRVILLP